MKVVRISADAILTSDIDCVLLDSGAGNVVLTWPASLVGHPIAIKRIDYSSNSPYVQVENQSTMSFADIGDTSWNFSTTYETRVLVLDGTQIFKIN